MFVSFSTITLHIETSFYVDDLQKWWENGLGYACLWPAFTSKMEVLRDWRKGL